MFMLPFTAGQFALWSLTAVSLAFVSRRALANPRCHGFYRFFAFIASAAVFIPNVRHWHERIFAPHQLFSWLLLFAGLAFLINGLYLLLSRGGHRPGDAAENFAFENTGELVESGLFRYIRHPMYGALLLFTAGVWLKQITVFGFACVLMTLLFLWLTAKAEEVENAAVFGDQYRRYQERTWNFIPFLF